MNSLPAFKTVTFLSAHTGADSSTESGRFAPETALKQSARPCHGVRVSGEVCLSPKAWRRGRGRRPFCWPVDAFGERKESVLGCVSRLEIPNRKERFISGFAPLLIDANTSEIGPFADQQRQQNAAADEMVMDRGAECIAGGCDAI